MPSLLLFFVYLCNWTSASTQDVVAWTGFVLLKLNIGQNVLSSTFPALAVVGHWVQLLTLNIVGHLI